MEMYLRQLITFSLKQGSACKVDRSIVEGLAVAFGDGKKNTSPNVPEKKPAVNKPNVSEGRTEESKNIPQEKESGGNVNQQPKPDAPNIHDDVEKMEYFDSEEELSKKLDKVADWVKKSSHVIVFTGAGISTR